MKRLAALAVCLHSACFALYERPWFGEPFELQFRSQYSHLFFEKAGSAVDSCSTPFFQDLLTLNLETAIPQKWSMQVELELTDPRAAPWGYRSAAAQATRLWLDDICGDPVSLTTGISYRDVPSRARRALSTPYHAQANFELHSAIGKEWSQGANWYFRTYGTCAFGQGTKGAPWLRGDLYLWLNFHASHQVRLYSKGYFGLGRRSDIPSEFSGWEEIDHRSIDCGVSYSYRLGYYGSLHFDYLYRVYARNYPQKVHGFILSYHLPFSPF